MPSRPMYTFQWEGWYRPPGSKGQHYFRLMDWEGGRVPSLESVCDNFSLSESFRPYLRSTMKKQTGACSVCTYSVETAMAASERAGWFGDKIVHYPGVLDFMKLMQRELFHQMVRQPLGSWKHKKTTTSTLDRVVDEMEALQLVVQRNNLSEIQKHVIKTANELMKLYEVTEKRKKKT